MTYGGHLNTCSVVLLEEAIRRYVYCYQKGMYIQQKYSGRVQHLKYAQLLLRQHFSNLLLSNSGESMCSAA